MKQFLTKEDLRRLLGDGASDWMVKKFFKKIREEAVEDLSKQGKIIPDKKFIPTIYVAKYLATYGIVVEMPQQVNQ